MDYVNLFTSALIFMELQYFGYVVVIVLVSRTLQRYGVDRRVQKEWPPFRQYVTEAIIAGRTVLINAFCYLVVTYLILNNMFPAPTQTPDYRWWVVALHCIVMFSAHDMYFYWTHRIMHHKLLFRTWHLEHHLARSPTPMTSMRMSIPEAFVQSGFFVLWGALMPDSPLSFKIVLFYIIFIGAVGHSGYEWTQLSLKKYPWLAFFTTVMHHDMHHLGSYNTNYGIHYTFWDRLCGTHNYAYEPRLIKFMEEKRAARLARKAAKKEARLASAAPAE